MAAFFLEQEEISGYQQSVEESENTLSSTDSYNQ